MSDAIPQAALDMIREFEGWSSTVYRDPVGVPTIGFGFTKGVTMNTPPMTLAAGEARLRRELAEQYAPALAPIDGLNANQRAALLSFIWNVGPGGVASSTMVGSALRVRDWQAAADSLLSWDRAGGRRLAGLTRRRQAERALFLKPATDALRGYPADERRWIRELDELVREDRDRDRRKVLRLVMTARRKSIWMAAQDTGWGKRNRRARYHSLLVRTRP